MLGSMHLPGSPYRLHCLFVEPCTPTPAAEQHPQFVDRPPEELTNRDSEDHSSKYEADHCPRGATPIRDRINEVVANNFVTDLGLAHAMANRCLCDIFYAGGIEADTSNSTTWNSPSSPINDRKTSVPKAKYDGKVEVMDSFRTSTYQKVHQIGNLEERLFPNRCLKPPIINYRVDAVHKEVHKYIQGRLKLLFKIHNISVGRTVTPLDIRTWPHQGEAWSSREQRWEKQWLKPCSRGPRRAYTGKEGYGHQIVDACTLPKEPKMHEEHSGWWAGWFPGLSCISAIWDLVCSDTREPPPPYPSRQPKQPCIWRTMLRRPLGLSTHFCGTDRGHGGSTWTCPDWYSA